jgi:hypothetical protein
MRLVVLLLIALTLAQGKRLSQFNPSGITDIEDFKRNEMREPLKTWLDFFISGARGFKDGYFTKYRHGKTDKRDERCFGKDAETYIYQIIYFVMKGELMDLETVMDDIYYLYSDTGRYCMIYETTMTLYDHCVVKHKCDATEMITNTESHIMKFVEIGMSVMDIFVSKGRNDKWSNPHDFGMTMYAIGEDIAEFIVALFGI